jgi:N-acylneuraminate cytidylyltransferase
VAVIPARGGSKRIPLKNIRPFRGRPVVARTIATLRAAGLFDAIVVSTDDPRIAEIARDAGAEVPFLRSPDLSDDLTPTTPVVLDAIDRYRRVTGKPIGEVCIAYPASPLLTPDDVLAAHRLLQESGVDSVFCAAAHSAPIRRAWRQSGDGLAEMVWPEFENVRSQDLEPTYFDAGQFYWWAVGTAERKASGEQLSTAMYVVDRWRIQDIDNEEDWVSAELAYEILVRLSYLRDLDS